jgi:hypothetical protein
VLLVPRRNKDIGVLLKCLVDILQLWQHTDSAPITVGAAVHIGHVRFEVDSLWDVAQSGTLRVLPGGPGPLKLKAMCARVGANAGLASPELMAAASQAELHPGLVSHDVAGGEVLLRLATTKLPVHLCKPMAPLQVARAFPVSAWFVLSRLRTIWRVSVFVLFW